jgi:hypothetical protein
VKEQCRRCAAELEPGAKICPQCFWPVAPEGDAVGDNSATAKVPLASMPLPQARPAVPRQAVPAPQRPKTGLPVWVWAAVGLIVVAFAVAAGYLWYTNALGRSMRPAGGNAQGSSGTPGAAPAAEVKPVIDLAVEYESLQAKANDTSRQMGGLLAKAQEQGGKLPATFGADLSEEQRKLLADRIQQERSGVRNLLQEILTKDQEIKDLRGQIASLEKRLPSYVVAEEGNRHDRIVMDFLIKQGVPAEKAYAIASSVNLEDALLPGFRVWTYFNNGQFGTWVTQGNAAVSPQEHQRRVKQLLVDARDEARRLADTARADADKFDAQRKAAEQQAVAASAESGAMLKIAEEERAKAVALDNTVRYAVGPRKILQEVGVIDRSNRIRAIDQLTLLSLNLAESTEIAVDASAHGMKSLRKVVLLPDMFQEGIDYKVKRDGVLMQLTILNPAKFKRMQFLIVLE